MVVDRVVDLVVHAPKIAVRETIFAFLSKLIEQFTKTLQVVAVLVLHTLLHDPTECSINITVIKETRR